MKERWDIYDENGIVTGRTMVRGRTAYGDYMLCVIVFIYNSNLQFLVQKRALTKNSYPGVWDVTSGAVLAGEQSIDAVKREVLEELGLHIRNEDVQFVGRLKRTGSLADVYFIKMDYELDKCILQKEEVEAVKSVDISDIITLVNKARPRDADYVQLIANTINNLRKDVDTASI